MHKLFPLIIGCLGWAFYSCAHASDNDIVECEILNTKGNFKENFALMRGEYSPSISMDEIKKAFATAIVKESRGDKMEALDIHFKLALMKYTPSTFMLGRTLFQDKLYNSSTYWLLLAVQQLWEDENRHHPQALDLLMKIQKPISQNLAAHYGFLYPLETSKPLRIKKSYVHFCKIFKDFSDITFVGMMLERLYLLYDQHRNADVQIFKVKDNETREYNRLFYSGLKTSLPLVAARYADNHLGADLRVADRLKKARKYYKLSDTPIARHELGVLKYRQCEEASQFTGSKIEKAKKYMLSANTAEAYRDLGRVCLRQAQNDVENTDKHAFYAYKYSLKAILWGNEQARDTIEAMLKYRKWMEPDFDKEGFEEEMVSDQIAVNPVEAQNSRQPLGQDKNISADSPTQNPALLSNNRHKQVAIETTTVRDESPSSVKVSLQTPAPGLASTKNQEGCAETLPKKSHSLNVTKAKSSSITAPEAVMKTSENPYIISFYSKKVEKDFHRAFEDQLKGKKLSEIINDILYQPWSTTGVGKPEVLKGTKGLFARRINKGERVVYQVSKGSVVIHSCEGHYYD